MAAFSYYDAPESIDVTDAHHALLERLGRTAAACCVAHGPRHGAVYAEDDRMMPAALLGMINEEGGEVIHAGVRPLPGDASNVTFRRSDADEGDRRVWVEYRLPELDQ